MRTLLFSILFGWLPVEHSFGQEQVVDSLKNQLEIHQKEDTAKVNILNELSYQFQWFNFYHSLGYAQRALKTAERLDFKKGISVAKYRIAHCYWELGDNELAIEHALQAAVIAEQEQFADILGESYKVLAITYRDQNENEKAEQYINRAEKLAIQTKNWDLLSRVYNVAGVIQFTKNRNDTALALYNRALSITKDHITSDFHLSQIYSNIGVVYGSEENSNPTLEYDFFKKALSTARVTRNRSAEASILNNIGKVLVKKNRYSEANKYFHESLALANELNVKRVIKNIYLSFVDLNVRNGKPKDAKAYLDRYNNLRDSLLNEKKSRQIIEIETRYEAEKKEQMIKLLEQERRIQVIWNDMWIVGTLFLLIAIITIYWLQQSRTRKARQLLEKQRELNIKLRETDLLKSRFFANISHEFRTPLSLILAPVEDKLSSSASATLERSDLQLIKRNADRLLDLINQLLDLSKLEVGKMKLRIQNRNIEEFLTILASSFDSLAENKGIQFSKSIATSSRNCWFDADKLEKIINNILFNAFKFTPGGGAVILSIHTCADEEDLFIKLTDTGKGIPEEDLPHVLSPFYQSKNTADDGQPGTGLGLSLVSELVKLYKGRIDIASQLNNGTTISITLPLSKHKLFDSEEVTVVESPLVVKRREGARTENSEVVMEEIERDEVDLDSILVIEDNVDLRNFIASGLRARFKIFTARDGEEGYGLAIQHIPTLVISDVMMPKMDGIDLTAKIRSDERTSHIPIVLLTAKIDVQSRLKGFKNGADDYIAKPFSKEELHVRVDNLIANRKKIASKFRAGISAFPKAPHEPSIDEKFLLHLRSVIEAHISEAAFGVEELANEMCLSRTQLFRKVKALIEIPPSELINDIRLQKAAVLIKAKADTLAQIGYSVGFNEQSYFAKRFRKKFGVPPSKYSEMA